MKFLIDTNIFIPLEPTTLTDVQGISPAAAHFAQLVSQTDNHLYVHSAALIDIRRDQNPERRHLRELLFRKYPALPDPPKVSRQLEAKLGHVEPEKRDWVDHQLIAAVEADAVDYLVLSSENIDTM